MGQAWRDFLGNWDGYRIDVEEYREIDDERVLILLRVSGRGRMSGVDIAEISPRSANVMHVCDGKVTRLVTYFDRARALDDLGMKE
jgi:ketosteroid isomerase-like protein